MGTHPQFLKVLFLFSLAQFPIQENGNTTHSVYLNCSLGRENGKVGHERLKLQIGYVWVRLQHSTVGIRGCRGRALACSVSSSA